MKRVLLLALVACFMLGGVATAKEVQMQGQFEHSLQWTDNTNFLETEDDSTSEDDFEAAQRVRMYFQYIDSENLRGVVGFELDTVWGSTTGRAAHYGGGAVGTDGGTVEIKHAYTDFSVADVNVRVGLQGLGWPSAVAGNPVMSGDVAGIVASYQFNEMFGLTAGWARLWNNRSDFTGAINADSGDDGENDEIDAFTLIAPVTMDGMSLTPYVIYAAHGRNASGATGLAGMADLRGSNATAVNDDMDIWWAGAAFELTMFDPFVFGADVVYGSVDGSNASENDREGWFLAAKGEYKMDMFTPGLAVMWGSGEDDDPSDGSEVMPTLAGGSGNRSGLALTHFGMNGAAATETGDVLLNGRTDFWAVALYADNISYVENLTHRVVLMYGGGTSDSDLIKTWGTNLNNAPTITDEDTFFEVNVDSTYQIYENLALSGKLGYINVDLDEDVWANADKTEDALKFILTLNYNF